MYVQLYIQHFQRCSYFQQKNSILDCLTHLYSLPLKVEQEKLCVGEKRR